jgi:catechol 2,3-dioxygenase-like lactoylglutathione lyase family enzyme
MSDLGLTHVALSVRNLNESIAFYTTYAAMKVVHQRVDTDTCGPQKLFRMPPAFHSWRRLCLG